MILQYRECELVRDIALIVLTTSVDHLESRFGMDHQDAPLIVNRQLVTRIILKRYWFWDGSSVLDIL